MLLHLNILSAISNLDFVIEFRTEILFFQASDEEKNQNTHESMA